MCVLGFTGVLLAWGSSSSWARETEDVVVLDGSPAFARLPGKQMAPGCPALTPVIGESSQETPSALWSASFWLKEVTKLTGQALHGEPLFA